MIKLLQIYVNIFFSGVQLNFQTCAAAGNNSAFIIQKLLINK